MVVSAVPGCPVLQQAGEINVDCVLSMVPSPSMIADTKSDCMFLARAFTTDALVPIRVEFDQAIDVESVCPDTVPTMDACFHCSRLEMNVEHMSVTGTSATMLYIIKPVWPSGLRR
jgi:hypothetical protein